MIVKSTAPVITTGGVGVTVEAGSCAGSGVTVVACSCAGAGVAIGGAPPGPCPPPLTWRFDPVPKCAEAVLVTVAVGVAAQADPHWRLDGPKVCLKTWTSRRPYDPSSTPP